MFVQLYIGNYFMFIQLYIGNSSTCMLIQVYIGNSSMLVQLYIGNSSIYVHTANQVLRHVINFEFDISVSVSVRKYL